VSTRLRPYGRRESSSAYTCGRTVVTSRAAAAKYAVVDDARPDAELLAATARDPQAFGLFYRRHEQRILRFFVRRVRDAELAADLTAETFAAALLSRDRYRAAEGAPPVAWLFGIAQNLLLQSLRRGRVEQRARQQLAMPLLDLTDELIERIDALRGDAISALADLPDDQRRAIEERVIEDRDYTEIGRALDCSSAVVRKRVSRGLQTLRAQLEDQ
jgi:RNA polymerase sigma factor (sigma-70 family)